MKYLKYVVFAVISTIIDLASRLLLNWIVAAFADKDGNLPKCLKWFQTFDATLDEGMLASRRELLFGGNTFRDFDPYPKTWFDYYMNRAKWLFRNSCYGFDYYLLGMDWKPEEWTVTVNEDFPDKSLFIAHSKNGFCFAYKGKYGTYKLGWKARNLFNKYTGKFEGTWGDAGRIPVTFSANPFKRKK